MLHPSPQRKQGKTRSITWKSGPDSLARASGLHGERIPSLARRACIGSGFPRSCVGLAWKPDAHPSPQRKQGKCGFQHFCVEQKYRCGLMLLQRPQILAFNTHATA